MRQNLRIKFIPSLSMQYHKSSISVEKAEVPTSLPILAYIKHSLVHRDVVSKTVLKQCLCNHIQQSRRQDNNSMKSNNFF